MASDISGMTTVIVTAVGGLVVELFDALIGLSIIAAARRVLYAVWLNKELIINGLNFAHHNIGQEISFIYKCALPAALSVYLTMSAVCNDVFRFMRPTILTQGHPGDLARQFSCIIHKY